MSDEEVAAYLSSEADEINVADGIKYDDWSRLTKATHVEKQITIRGETIQDMDQLAENYFASRETQAATKLCNDDVAKAALSGGARYIYNWFSADGKELGMVRAGGETWCADQGF
ncbi:hypothetical protein [Sulfitobacter aestuariivivens]|uniref:Uncharacterized protein n=1 Tax=Sulfitobacter aestuariivivens TaxID=2766981 RepID=A0A927HEA8_9RHOB|nr:hypothetical protein [Sulfitobacter aestuariivivens]MBD3663188.1 hypothetical protein [Sulfitobacter aestuariivivens]